MVAKQSFALLLMTSVASAADIPNRLIDYDKFQAEVGEVRDLRAAHRVTESQFLRMSKDPATVILDARSAEKFALAKVIPSKTTRVAHLLQQQLPQRAAGVSVEATERVAQRAHDERAVCVRLHERLRAWTAHRHPRVEARIRR